MQQMNQPGLENPRGFGPDAETEEAEDPQEGVPATEEEQAQYDLIVSRAIKLMYGEARDEVLETLGSGESPAQSIGLVTARMARQMKESAKEQDKEFSEEVLYQAGAEIVEELSELGQEAGVFQFNNEQEAQEQTEEGMLWAMKYWGEDALQRGEIDPQEAQQVVQEEVARENPTAPVTRGVREAMHGAPPEKPGLIGAAMGGK